MVTPAPKPARDHVALTAPTPLVYAYDERDHDPFYCEAATDHSIPCGCDERESAIIRQIEWTDLAGDMFADDDWANR